VSYGDVFLENERQQSAANFEGYDVAGLKRRFEDMEGEVENLLGRTGPQGQALVLPAYDHVLKASHLFNLMDARGAIAVAERQSYIGRIRDLCRRCARPGWPSRARRPDMPQLLLELFSEEIPARMQAQAGRDLERLFRERLADQGLLPEAVQTYAGPRRLTLVADGLPAAQKDRTQTRRGPAHHGAGAGAGGLPPLHRPRARAADRGGRLLPRDHRHAGAADAGDRRRGRPRHPARLPLAQVHALRHVRLPLGAPAQAHPLHLRRRGGPVRRGRDSVRRPDRRPPIPRQPRRPVRRAPVRGLRRGAGARARRARPGGAQGRILAGARTLCFAAGLELVDDPGLLDEVAGLAEWPTPVLGDMDPAFLDLPPEVIRTSMRTHQKYFAVRRAGEAGLAPHFITVANIEAPDGGRAIAAGNAKVLSARLSDARFFWEQDRAPASSPGWRS
jgi:glycyl-tRNA synthetase beta chain